MDYKIIYRDEYFCITSQLDGIYLETYKAGFTFEDLNNILSQHREIEITSFLIIKNAIGSAPRPPEKIGRFKDRITLDIVENGLKAFIVYNLPMDELSLSNRENLIKETNAKLKEHGVVFGVKNDMLYQEIFSGKPYLIAEGIPPINGADAEIKMYNLEEAKPTVHKDGKVDFYELKLINRVNTGDWLGERIDATDGTPGQSVKGEPIEPLRGKSINLNYDKNSVYEETTGNVTTLFARVNGAVTYVDGKISVSNHLEIDGNVDFKTGNIKFDGYLTIKGTVADGFQVEATKDIEINGDLGLGSVKSVNSTMGSIFIKGGIAGRNKAEISAAKSVFTKYIESANVICGEALHIGFYCINSNVAAKEVIIESANGHILGGNIKAEVKVSVPVLGSESEKRTIVEVKGFDRQVLLDELNNIQQRLLSLKDEQMKAKLTLTQLNSKGNLTPLQRKEFDEAIDKLASIRDEVKNLDEKRKTTAGYLKARGEGEISITKKVYPNCMLLLGKNVVEITQATQCTTYYIQDQELKQA
mgnify:CR=1 FL=1